MKDFGFAIAVVIFAAAIVASQSYGARAEDELEPGLVAEYFQFAENLGDFPPIPKDKKPTLVRVDKQVNFEDTTGDFYGAKMTDNFYTRWTGVVHVNKAGSHTFFSESDDGSQVSIDNKTVVTNGGVHPMTEASGKIDLTEGNHEIKIEFFQGGGGAGCKVSWQPPSGKREPISEKALFHKKGSDNIDWDKSAWNSKPKAKSAPAAKAGKPDKMDYGPFHTATVEGSGAEKGNYANKGLAIKLTKDTTSAPPPEGKVAGKMAAICFDTDMLRVAFGWTDGFLTMPTGRDGLEGHPVVLGNIAFGNKVGPGWGKGDDFTDPRVKHEGPLPADWAKYKGLYLNGDKVILSYTVGNTAVLELPGFESKDGADIFTRAFSINKSDAPLNLLVSEQDKSSGGVAPIGQALGAEKTGPAASGLAILNMNDTYTVAGLIGAPEGVTWQIAGTSKIQLKIPALANPAKFTVCIWHGSKDDLPKFTGFLKTGTATDIESLTKGGPPRWTPELTTEGTLGKEEGAYAVDTVTIPFENPWNAYMRITGLDFFPDGHRAAVCTMSGDVWVISGIDDKLEKLTWKRYATGLFQSLGLRIVDNTIYTLGRDQITRFHDLNNDGEADFYECFNNDGHIGHEYHEFAHDLQTDSAGNFYYARGSNLSQGGTIHNGTLDKVSKDGSKLEVIAVGFRAPNGMCVGPNDVIVTGDNQGNWTPSSPINWIYPDNSPMVKPGTHTFEGFRLDAYPYTKEGPRINPICWVPYDQDNSCGGQVFVTSDKWGPFKDHLMHLSYGKCKMFHCMYEKVGDEMQGGTVKFPLVFASGIMRARMNPVDGQLYVAGMRGWQTDGNKPGCVQRVRYTGKPVHMPLDYHVTKTGIDVTFTETLDPASVNDLESWSAKWFNIHYTKEYGSPEFLPSDDKKKGREVLPIVSAKLHPDGKTVTLEIPTLKPVNNIVIKYKIKFADGASVSQDLNVTINRMP